MKLVVIPVLFFFATNTLFAQNSKEKPSRAESIVAKVDEYVQPYLNMQAWSGVISITQDGKSIFRKAYGEANREWGAKNTLDTKFRIASISKLFTEVAILKLVESSKLSLAETLETYLPDYPRGNEVTIGHLLNHTSGIPHINHFPGYNNLTKYSYEIGEIIEFFKDKPFDFEPGEKYNYSNSGYVLLAYIIEKTSGLTYAQFLEKEIFEPYGMENTGIDSNDKILSNRAKGYMFGKDGKPMNAEYVDMSIKIGGGNLYSTVLDIDNFMHQLVSGEVLKTTLEALPNFSEKDGERIFVAQGRVQGFCHRIIHRVDENLTITVLGNNYTNIALPITDDLYKMYTGRSYAIPKDYLSSTVSLSVEELKKYEGTYNFNFGPLRVLKVIDGQLTYESVGTDRPDILIPIGDDTFFYTRYWVLVKFKKESTVGYDSIEWVMGDNTWTAQKVNGDRVGANRE